MVTQARYTSSGFSGLLDDIQSRLGELKFIDDALDYLEEVKDLRYDYESYVNRRDPLNMDSSPGILTSVELGDTHPFTKHVTTRDFGDHHELPDSDELEEHISSLRGPADEWAGGVVEGVRSSVEDLVEPLVAAFYVVAEGLENDVATPLSTLVADDFGGLQQSLGDWDGQAADNFGTNFYHPFGDCQENQTWLASELAKLFGACAALLNLGRNSLMNVANAVNEALDDQLLKRKEDNESPSLFETLKMLSTLAGLLGVVTMPVPAVSAVFGGVGTVLGYAAEAVPDDEGSEVLNIEGASASELAEQLETEIADVMSSNDDHWRQLRSERISVLEGLVEDVLAEHLLFPRRPLLADGLPQPGEFTHESAAG